MVVGHVSAKKKYPPIGGGGVVGHRGRGQLWEMHAFHTDSKEQNKVSWYDGTAGQEAGGGVPGGEGVRPVGVYNFDKKLAAPVNELSPGLSCFKM